MNAERKRYRAFMSYSQRDRAIARRIHRALEVYRVPAGIDAAVGPDRGLGRFFRDDDEMGASQSLGAALEGALDDSENLIVICSPSAARSKWVDAEVRRFKKRDCTRVFAVIAAGEPHAADPDRECFPPSLKVKFAAAGNPTKDPDEPRAPNLQREGLRRVRAQLAAGLLGIPFDALWQRERRRTMRTRLLASTAGLAVLAVLAVVGYGWLVARMESRTQAANQAIALARSAAADGRIGEALTRLGPFVEQRVFVFSVRFVVECFVVSRSRGDAAVALLRPLRRHEPPNPLGHVGPRGVLVFPLGHRLPVARQRVELCEGSRLPVDGPEDDRYHDARAFVVTSDRFLHFLAPSVIGVDVPS